MTVLYQTRVTSQILIFDATAYMCTTMFFSATKYLSVSGIIYFVTRMSPIYKKLLKMPQNHLNLQKEDPVQQERM